MLVEVRFKKFGVFLAQPSIGGHCRRAIRSSLSFAISRLELEPEMLVEVRFRNPECFLPSL